MAASCCPRSKSFDHLQIIEWRGKPQFIRCDNGIEYVSHLLADWAAKHDIELKSIEPSKPQQHAYIERLNRTVRYG